MNNQVKLIDADKLLEWMSKQYIGFTEKFEEQLKAKISIGDFDPDTPLVPTIKPGDKVKHKLNWFGIGEVQKIRGRKAYVTFAGYDADDLYDFCELEVVE